MDSTATIQQIPAPISAPIMAPAMPPDSPAPMPAAVPTPLPTPAPKNKSIFAPFLASLRAIPINLLTLALLLICILFGLLALPASSQIPAILNLAAASLLCVGLDVLAVWLAKKQWKFSQTSLISGLIIGSILAPETSLALTAAIAILSVLFKHLLREGPFPIFNPAAAGLVLGGLLFGTLDAWWATGFSGVGLLVVLAALLLLSWRQNRWRMEISFLLFFMLTWALVQHLPPFSGKALDWLNSLLGLLPLFLMGFMLLEPKTSSMRAKQQYVYGAIAAVFGVLLLSVSSRVDMILVGLLIANLAKKGMEKLKLLL